MAQEYIAKYRQASSEFEEARLRLRREISKDVERARREVLAEHPRGRRQPRSRRRLGRPGAVARGRGPGHRHGAAAVSREARRARRDADRRGRRSRSIRSCTRLSRPSRLRRPSRTASWSASSVTATASATTCCGRRRWPSGRRNPELERVHLSPLRLTYAHLRIRLQGLRPAIRGFRDCRAHTVVPWLPGREARQAPLQPWNGGRRGASRRVFAAACRAAAARAATVVRAA